MENVRSILIYAKEVEYGKIKFVACTANINGRWFKIKFRRDCQGAPTTKGQYDLTIDLSKCSAQPGKKFTRKDGSEGIDNPTIWVSEIKTCTKVSAEKLQEENAKRMAAVFDGEELPF